MDAIALRAVAPVLLPIVLLGTGCASSTLHVDAPPLSAGSATVCHRLIGALPSTAADQHRLAIDTDGAAAAWGKPPIVLRCGVSRPAWFRPSAHCYVVNRVGWLHHRVSGGDEFVTFGRAAEVQLTVPGAYEPAADALVDLASALRRTDAQRRACA